MKGMGYRTIKTAVGAGLAIWLAELFNLDFASFAAIIVIMCIEKTKKKTLFTIQKKFFASMIALLLGSIFFELIGYHPIALAIFIILLVPALMKFNVQAGFVTSMVVVMHIYVVGEANIANLLNELYIVFIGMGIALLVNSIMPSLQKDLDNYKKEIENRYQTILYEFSAHLKDNTRVWDGKEILEAEELINNAKSVAIEDVENHILRKEDKDYNYLEMREDQLEILKQMLAIVSIVYPSNTLAKQQELLGDFLLFLSEQVSSGDTTDLSLKRLDEYEKSIRKMELPKTREELDVRANLHYLNFELRNYLHLKKKVFAEKDRG